MTSNRLIPGASNRPFELKISNIFSGTEPLSHVPQRYSAPLRKRLRSLEGVVFLLQGVDGNPDQTTGTIAEFQNFGLINMAASNGNGGIRSECNDEAQR
ncbi:hypothetical protein HNR39_001065 [Glaciimonas immobilis]|uniref:Uncharacterized protein n=1 Tax=Glaciimonas immobilis TaxID=728004 RepID=A0A840RQH3_9BURK|nr:hypothetical protein [Glaciimonas immobilis]